jgi:hypothetical protein
MIVCSYPYFSTVSAHDHALTAVARRSNHRSFGSQESFAARSYQGPYGPELELLFLNSLTLGRTSAR